MVRINIDELMKKAIAGKLDVNPGYQNPEVAKAIATDWIKKDLQGEGWLPKEEDVERLNKAVYQYFGKKDLAQQILNIQPFYFDDSHLWWYWHKEEFCWKIVDETDIMNVVSKLSTANTIKAKEKNEILEALRQESRLMKPKPIKPTWIQFKDVIFDIENGERFKATPKYFAVNPLPYPLHPENIESTPAMDKLFEEWVGKDYVKTLYQILAYCMLPDYPLHSLFCFMGYGMNGKSCFLRLLGRFIGIQNVTSTELDTLLSSRFEVTKLYKKLAVIMGETNFAELSKTSIIKKLTGQDMIGFEFKNKTPFDANNYAKILIATNNLPTTDDKTLGFYRRWLIIDFPNQFSEDKDILSEIPEEEYQSLSLKCCSILHDLLKERKFHNQGDVEERMRRFEERSNPFDKFIRENCDTDDPNGFIWKFEFEKRFGAWCKEHRFRAFSLESVGRKMREAGFQDGRKYSEWLIDGEYKQLRGWFGLKWKQ